MKRLRARVRSMTCPITQLPCTIFEADIPQASNKPKLGAAKAFKDIDTSAYDDVLDDDDFM